MASERDEFQLSSQFCHAKNQFASMETRVLANLRNGHDQIMFSELERRLQKSTQVINWDHTSHGTILFYGKFEVIVSQKFVCC
jgi:hypothetical protein